jgi:hypothetical protein
MALDPAARADVGDPAMWCLVLGIVHGGEGSTLVGLEEWYGYGCEYWYWQPRWKCRTKGSQCAGSRESGKESVRREMRQCRK